MPWTIQEKAQFVLWFAELKSVVGVQRRWKMLNPERKKPDDKTLKRWMESFKTTGSITKRKSSGRSKISKESIEKIEQSCLEFPQKSIAKRSQELNIPKSTIQKVIKRYHLLKNSTNNTKQTATTITTTETLSTGSSTATTTTITTVSTGQQVNTMSQFQQTATIIQPHNSTAIAQKSLPGMVQGQIIQHLIVRVPTPPALNHLTLKANESDSN